MKLKRKVLIGAISLAVLIGGRFSCSAYKTLSNMHTPLDEYDKLEKQIFGQNGLADKNKDGYVNHFERDKAYNEMGLRPYTFTKPLTQEKMKAYIKQHKR